MSINRRTHAVIIDIHTLFNRCIGVYHYEIIRRVFMRLGLLAPLFCVGLLSVTARAQPAPPLMMMPTTLQVSATAEVRGAPDMAMISAGVVTQAAGAKAAMQTNATRMTAVMDAIRAAGIEGKDIQTSGISLQPQYRYADNQAPVITGYQASNTVNVRIRKIEGVGPVLDALVAKGANQINGPTFLLSNEEALMDAARKDAVSKARKRAALYADAAGLKIKRIISLSESGAVAQPMPMMQAMAMDARSEKAASPVAPGESTLSATINMVFELGL
jgi:uncharacterized protein